MNMLRPSWSDYRRRHPHLQLRDVADELGTTEVELLARDCGRPAPLDRVQRLTPAWPAILAALPKLGRVKAVTSHRLGSIEQLGRYAGSPERTRRPGALDVQLTTARWSSVFAVVEPGRGARGSLHIFDEQGAAAHQIYLEPESSRDAFAALVERARHVDQSPVEPVTLPPRACDRKDDDVDVGALRQTWERSATYVDPPDPAPRFGLGRGQLLRLLGRRWARPVRPSALPLFLEEVAEAGIPVALRLDNGAVQHGFAAALGRVRHADPWLRAGTASLDVRLRSDAEAHAYVVEQPSRLGARHWLELVDDESDGFVRIGARQPLDEPEPRAWRYSLRALVLDGICRVEPEANDESGLRRVDDFGGDRLRHDATEPARHEWASCDAARDHATIAAMAGDFHVRFAFDETDVLAPGYTRHAPYRAQAHEVVTVLEDSPHKLVLQHLLMMEGDGEDAKPLKHWRQDWTFEKRALVEFRGRRRWARRELTAAEARCTWSQAVFEVDDGPRYESIGRWAYDAAGATWQSATTWRPLPRREYTKRSDYDVLVGVNRHVVTARGWSHEQDNVKLVLNGDKQLVRERGVNEYTRMTSNAPAVARRYLDGSGDFWRIVRAEWQALFDAHAELTVQALVDGQPLYDKLFPLADSAPPAGEPLRRQVHALMAPYVAAPALAAGNP